MEQQDRSPTSTAGRRAGVVTAAFAATAAAMAVWSFTQDSPVSATALADNAVTALVLVACAAFTVAAAAWLHVEPEPDSSLGVAVTRVWTFAAVLTLPDTWTFAVAAIIGLLETSLWSQRRRTPANTITEMSILVIAAWLAHQVFSTPEPTQAMTDAVLLLFGVLAAVTFEATYTAAGWLRSRALRRPSTQQAPLRDTLRRFGVRGSLLSFGGVVAWIVVTAPWLTVLLLPPVVLLLRALQHDTVRARLRTDAKTGAASGTWWRQVAMREVERARVTGSPVAVLLFDLDHFKAVNDTYNHLIGDAVLAHVVAHAASAVRARDVLGRFGGEEFTVLLPGAHLDRARDVAERIRAAVESDPYRDGDLTVPVTISVGVAAAPPAPYDTEDLLLAADEAMLAAKRGGRNRIHVA